MVTREKNHFTDAEWADFLNGQLAKEQKQKMQGHLDTSCKSCSKAFAVWQKVHAAAKRESQYEVPEWALRHVRNAFSAATKPRNTKRAFQIPRLVFDSFWQPALAGTRSTATAARQLRYRFGDTVVELQIEPEVNPERVSITGQISDMVLTDEVQAGVQILMFGSEGKVVKATTNQFGEFHLIVERENNLEFSIGLKDGRDLFIPLDLTRS